MNSEKTIVGQCPLCGGNVVKTLTGYACENSLTEQPSCGFFLFSMIGNRRISDSEASLLLSEKKILLDGFASKEGKNFSSILMFNQDGSINMNSQLGTCPKCGGMLYVGPRSISCGNFKDSVNPCKFTIWRNTAGHDFSLSELEALIVQGATENEVDTYDKQGNRQRHRFGLNDSKEVIKL